MQADQQKRLPRMQPDGVVAACFLLIFFVVMRRRDLGGSASRPTRMYRTRGLANSWVSITRPAAWCLPSSSLPYVERLSKGCLRFEVDPGCSNQVSQQRHPAVSATFLRQNKIEYSSDENMTA
jgi:hypothetical protein